jgi:hypothetical protein
MKIETNEQSEIILKEVFSGIGLESPSGEKFSICMRDSGFEFNYGGKWYRAVEGILTSLDNEPIQETSNPSLAAYKQERIIELRGELGVRAINGLKLAKIETIGQLLKVTKRHLYGCRNLGHRSIQEIVEMLESRGLKLKQTSWM